jgi:hypothetical protein
MLLTYTLFPPLSGLSLLLLVSNKTTSLLLQEQLVGALQNQCLLHLPYSNNYILSSLHIELEWAIPLA